MQVKDVMTRQVIGIPPHATIAEAVNLLLQSGISGLPVVDEDGAVVGIVSEGDFLRRAELGTQDTRASWLECLFQNGWIAGIYAHAHGRRVGQIMTSDVISIEEDAPLEQAVTLMEKHRVKRLPVLRDHRLTGIVSRVDLVRALARRLNQPREDMVVDDGTIKAQIEAELKAERWAPAGTVRVEVSDGIVGLHGLITDKTQRNALQIMAENTMGVKAVHDHLIWAEPFSGIVRLPPG